MSPFGVFLLCVLGYIIVGLGFVFYTGRVHAKNEQFLANLLHEYKDSGLRFDQVRSHFDHTMLLLWPWMLVVAAVTWVKLSLIERPVKKAAKAALRDYVNEAGSDKVERAYRKNFIKYARKQMKLHAKRSPAEWSRKSSQRSDSE